MKETVLSPEAKQREQKILMYQTLREEGCTEKTALLAIQTSRATFYRWKKEYQTNGNSGLILKSKRPKNTRKPI